ncbi:zf-TFIIB domain-containing protein [Crateriforma spongiae]|uniref:zf-TFIIB domain-containing protein n=1 Tax=Crateriforma spongiae TaxID=2724528 RepID=UPI001445B6AB|nr:zf-TFIIB domain-containing protein [Crateriforma spongiae]
MRQHKRFSEGRVIKPKIKKNIFGKYEVKFDCPKCGVRLTSPLTDAGEVDDCPDCRAKFRVPGKEQRAAYEAKLAKEQAEKEAERELKNEERRIAAEEKRLQQEERRLQQEEEQRRRELIIAEEEKQRRRDELASLAPPTVTGEIVGPASTAGEIADVAECPFCAELVSLRARKCKHCGELLDPVLRAAEEGRRASATPQIVNVVHGGNATASADASAEASVSSVSSCGGCLSAIILLIIIIACAGALSG